MRATTSFHKQIPKKILILVLTFLVVSGCLSPVVSSITPSAEFDAVGTAQAQASGLEFSPPPQDILPDFERWVREHSYEIKSLDSTDYSDLQFLEPLLEGKRIVQLGEDEHFTVEQSLMKIRLIKYLHQELDYEVIALETSLMDCYRANVNIINLSPTEAMDHVLYGNPKTEDYLSLFEYIKETSSSPSPLIFAGFDIISFGEGPDVGPGSYYSLVEDLDSNYASEIRILEELFLFPAGAEEILKNVNDIVGYQNAIQMYDDLAAYINQNQQILQQFNSSYPGYVNVAEQAAWSRARYIEAFQ